MPVYQYRGLRSDGGAAAGIVDAESLRGARVKLRQGGIFPTELREQATAGWTAVELADQLRKGKSRRRVLSPTDLAIATRQFATLLVAGLPLVEALGILVEQVEKKPVQSLFAEIREQVRGGKALSAALEQHPNEFGPIYVHMVRAGEASGALDQILFRLSEFLEKQLALKQKVTNAMMYPVIMLLVGAGVLFVLMTFAIPKITVVFTDQKKALPWPTVVLMQTSNFLAEYWWVLLSGAVIGLVAFLRYVKTSGGQLRVHQLLLKLPLIGDIVRKVAISRLSSTLATMLASGVQLLEALDVSRRVMSNRVLEAAVENARQNIREGESIAAPLKRSGQFPPLVTHMVAVGEKSGEMEEMLRRIAGIYDGEVDRVVTRATSLIEPVMILFMGAVVFFIVVAILLPIFEMGQLVR
ncbi:type II secretion system protein [Nitrospira sp.]|nr:type II secretion system protein [Nitrospira sp.]